MQILGPALQILVLKVWESVSLGSIPSVFHCHLLSTLSGISASPEVIISRKPGTMQPQVLLFFFLYGNRRKWGSILEW